MDTSRRRVTVEICTYLDNFKISFATGINTYYTQYSFLGNVFVKIYVILLRGCSSFCFSAPWFFFFISSW